MSSDRGDITRLVADWAGGDDRARDRLIPLVYDELRRLAASFALRERAGHTLQPTALVHEAFLRFSEQGAVPVESRGQFMALIARTMRRVLIDHARARAADKRGGGATIVPLDEARDGIAPVHADVLRLDGLLERLARLDPRQAEVVQLRVFGGFEVRDVAAALEVSTATVKRDWAMARAWLYRELGPSRGSR